MLTFVAYRLALRRIRRAIRSGDAALLDRFDPTGTDVLSLAAAAARAVILLRHPDQHHAHLAFMALERRVRHAPAPEHALLRSFCLYHLARLLDTRRDWVAHADEVHLT